MIRALIDLHSHVLPGIDDGAETLEDALAMAALAARSGTRVLAATPHVRADYPNVVPAEVVPRVDELNRVLRERGIDLEVTPGGEVALLDALERPLDELRAVTLGGNGRDLLVETPFAALPTTFENLLAAVAGRGFRVVLAHPEVSADLVRQPDRLEALVQRGVLVQVTGSAFESGRQSSRRRLVVHAVREGWVHCIASDGHRATWRPPTLDGPLRAALGLLPQAEDYLRWLVTAAPRAILAGEELPPPPAVTAARRRRFRALRRR